MMYKITKDQTNENTFKVTYFLAENMNTPLYHIENCSWTQVMEFVKHTQINTDDSTWMHDVIRLTEKKVFLNEHGDWRVL